MFKVYIVPPNDYGNPVYFYLDEKMNCVPRDGAPCPENDALPFDYEKAIKVEVKPNFKKINPLPWKTFTPQEPSNTSDNTLSAETNNRENTKPSGVGPVYREMSGKWVPTPPLSGGGSIFSIYDIQKGTQAGFYKKIANEKEESAANLNCIHADQNGYIFLLEFTNMPSWYNREPRYLHIKKQERKGKVIYKYHIAQGAYDTTFSKGKMGYSNINHFRDLRKKGYASNWWFWNAFE